jgi:ABC-type lipoprotein release transport system permease subunit
MPTLGLILKELLHRKLNSVLSALAVLVTVALFIAFLTMAEAARRETVRVTRDLGFNLRIIPKETDMDRFWAAGYSEHTMPEDTLHRFAKYDRVFLTYNHLVGTLQHRFSVGGREVLLTGLAPTITAPEQRGRPMGYEIKSGSVIVGYQVAQRLGLKKGATLTLGGRTFTVERCLVESGDDDDIRIFGALADVQRVLGLEGRINEIKAIDCLCLTADQDPLKVLRAELEKALPEAKVIQLRTLADARAKQRQTADRYFGFMSPFLLLACAAWVGVLAVLNVRERRAEIGILRALGHGAGRIGGLFLGKAVLIGLIGAALGWCVGTGLALQFGPDIFRVTAKAIEAEWGLLGWAVLVAPAFAALASFIPAMLAVTLDPAHTLREQ